MRTPGEAWSWAVGQGRVVRGKATLTRRVLHQMTSGKYNVTMTVAIKTSTVMGLRWVL
jgi:hypothetical protein